jgi:hypothetical protein
MRAVSLHWAIRLAIRAEKSCGAKQMGTMIRSFFPELKFIEYADRERLSQDQLQRVSILVYTGSCRNNTVGTEQLYSSN